MKKAYVLMVMMFVAVASASAQSFSFGPRFGVSSSDIKLDKSDLTDIQGAADDVKYKVESGDAALGIHAGIFARVSVLGIYIQPEAIIATAGGEFKYTDLTNEADPQELVTKISTVRLDVPVMVGKKFAKVLRVQAGPTFSYALSAKEEIVDSFGQDIEATAKSTLEDAYSNATMGYQVGLGLDLWKLVVDFKYEGSLGNMASEVAIPGTTYTAKTDQRNSQLVLSIGIKII